MEECVNQAPGADTLFPVCISCVLNVELRARACFLCVMGARPRHPGTETTHPDRLIYTHTGSRVYTLRLCLCVYVLASATHCTKILTLAEKSGLLGEERTF